MAIFLQQKIREIKTHRPSMSRKTYKKIFAGKNFLFHCLFTKHILASGSVTIDRTDILCTPKRLSDIARHFIPSTFFSGSADCLLISQNVNKKNYATFKMGIFGSETTKNQLLSIKLLPKNFFRNFFTHICSYFFTFSITLKCRQMAVSL